MKTAFRRHRMLLSSLVLGVAAFILSLSVVSSYVKAEPVVIALKDVEPHQRIVPGDVALCEIPVKAVPKGCMNRVDLALGAYARSRLLAGQIVLAGHIVRGVGEAGWSFDLPPDMRGMFLPVPAARALGGALKRGERVDVIVAARQVSMGFPGMPGGACTAVRGLEVLDVVKEASSGEFMGVIVLADPIQCETLARHLEEGGVYLSLVSRLAQAYPQSDAHTDEKEMGVWPAR